MTNVSAPSRQPVSLSFKEFRDEEIVEFFANESRSFHPDPNAGGHLFRSRIVGAPHFVNNPKKDGRTGQKPTAAFQTSIRLCDAASVGTDDSIPLSDDSPDDRSSIRVARIPDPLKRKRKPSVEPAFGKPTRPLGSLLAPGRTTSPDKESRAARIVRDPLKKSRSPIGIEKKSGPKGVPVPSPVQDPRRPAETELLERFRETDERLRQLIESWPTLPAQLKETIATLIEVSEQSGG